MIQDSQDFNSVIIVVPIKNESGNISEMARIFNLANKEKTILLFSEGGSTDNSFETAKLMSLKYRNVFTIKQEGLGKLDAVTTVAKKHPRSILAIWDGDHTISYEDLCKCIDASENGKYFVYGNRLAMKPKTEVMPLANFLANTLFAKVFSYVFRERISDALCGTKIIKSTILVEKEKIRENLEDTFGDLSYFLLAKTLKFPFREVDVSYSARVYGTSKLPRWSFAMELIRDLLRSYKLVKTSAKKE
jgi:hypothetical protein